MKTFTSLLLLLLLLACVPGCGNDKEKGMNRPSVRGDQPRAAPTDRDK